VVSFESRLITVTETSFNEVGQYWEASLTTLTTPGQISFIIDGQKVASWGQFVQPVQGTLTISKVPPDTFSVASNLAAATTFFNIHQDGFAKDSIYFENSAMGLNRFRHTESGFRSMSGTRTHANFASATGILGFAFTRNHVLGLDGFNVCIFSNQGASKSVLTTFANRIISVRDPLLPLEYNSPFNDLVIAWNSARSTNSVSVLHLSVDEGKTFKPIDITVDEKGVGAGGYIAAVCFYAPSQNVLVLIRDADGSDRLIMLNPFDTQQPFRRLYERPASQGSLLDSSVKGSKMGMTSSNGGWLYLWGDNLYASDDGGNTINSMILQGKDKNAPNLDLLPSEYIKQVVVESQGDLSVLTSINRYIFSNLGYFLAKLEAIN
jgi:hypothetical protein